MFRNVLKCTIIIFCTATSVICQYNDRPKIKTLDGDLIIEAAADKNIYIRPRGSKSSIFVGNINILNVNASNSNPSYQPSSRNDLDRYMNGPNGILRRLDIIEGRVMDSDTVLNTSLLRRRINRLTARVAAIESRLDNVGRDDCQSHPCQHGGTCLSLFNGYHCLCPSNWEGQICDEDVNECRNFAGTDLGCQNGATCINKPGSYECMCKTGWFGLHCTRKLKDCSGGDYEMCGHGHCIPTTTGEGITCICHQGWTNNGSDITCLTDINECESIQGPRCSINPKVSCVNLPGSFRCGPCPLGYEGDGYICSDIDECISINNGGCSTNPMVSCHNTIGSRICGPCPSGYIGDGVTCIWRGSCNINHGGCHPSAQCIENNYGSQVAQCVCPEGMAGDGIGVHGCYVSGNNSSLRCENNPCGARGHCIPLSTGYTCLCFRGYTGIHCDSLSNDCLTNPCQNGGSCRSDDRTVRGFRCECTAQYSGELCQIRSRSCGGVLNEEEGSIIYPLTNTSYSHNSRCAWVIRTAPEKVINVTFSKFNLEFNPNCMYDFLQIHDGRSSASQLLGRFCGSEFPLGGNIVSSHNNLYFWFRSDETVAKDGFALHWTSILPICGGEVDATKNGRISSPGSPGNYPPNRDCYWSLNTNQEKRIQILFYELDIEQHANCSYDYLEIYDGIDATYPLLHRICNSSLPGPIQSSGAEMYIHFHSDEYSSGKGFQITFVPIDGIPGCGGFYTADRSQIVSPSYNGKYLNDMFCEYNIRTSPGTKIRLNFESFKLESSFRCAYDYLKIYDGPSSTSGLVGQYCGSTYPKVFTSNTNNLFMVFKTDGSLSMDGFVINYKTICQQNIVGDSGVIKSPGYPISYQANKVCEYIIETTPRKAIQLTFQDFDVEDNSETRCFYDYVEVRDGSDSNSTLLGRYCGNTRPGLQTSTQNYLYLKFVSDMSISGGGFYANYTTFETGCGGIYRKNSGIISHPSENEDHYKNDEICTWMIIAPPGMHIEITWNDFDIEESTGCKFDSVKLIEVDDNSTEYIVGTFCGNEKPPALTTATSRLKVQFESDSSVKLEGFSIMYEFLDDSHCGGRYARDHGNIYSPGWPSRYEANRDCIWIITVPVGQQISLNISQFDLERPIGSRCDLGDYLEIRNGGSTNSSLLGKYCGSFQYKRIISMSNSLFIKFHSDVYLSGNGFKIEWDGTLTGCGGLLSSPSGTLMSPNYPEKYHNNAYCLYKIVANSGSRIKLSFVDLQLESSNDCYYDYVEIYDGKDDSFPSLGKLCEISSRSNDIETSGNYAFIKFRSDYSIGQKGFLLRYNTICHNNLTGIYGVIESPGYPGEYERNMNCLWTISVPKGNKINVTFTHFDIFQFSNFYTPRYPHSYGHNSRLSQFRFSQPYTFNIRDNCDSNYLKYKEKSDRNFTDSFCGQTKPSSFTSKTNSLQIMFATGFNIPKTGFRLEWIRHGCGGHIVKSFGTINFDKSLTSTEEIECEWLIETPIQNSISITFNHVYMDETENCTSDSIEVYNGQNVNMPLLTKFCHKGVASAKSSSNFMIVKLTKKSSLRDIDFSARFVAMPSSCGGFVESVSGVIHSDNYPRDYENNMDCSWTIKVPDHHRIKINFVDLDLYKIDEDETCGDNIKIYEGDNILKTNYSQLICPNSNFTEYITKNNRLRLQFTTDEENVAKGFKANFTAICGGVIQASKDGILHANKLVSHSNLNCTWIIIAPINEKVLLTITHMSLPKNNSIISNRHCSTSYLRIYDGDDTNAPVIDEYCGRKVPPMITSHSSAITVQLGSYTEVVTGQFSAHYTTLNTACGGILTSEEGTIASPNYPGSYPAGINCEWVLQTSAGNSVYLTFEKFDLEYSEGCNEDYLEVRENDGGGNLLYAACGNNLPRNKTISSKIYIKFHSDNKDSGQGFIIHYGFMHGNEINSLDNGEISSPLYPNLYDGAAEYSWRIYVTGSDKINVVIDHLEIPGYGQTCHSYLAFYDGYDEEAQLLSELCGMVVNQFGVSKVLQSSSSVVFIKLKLDPSNTGSLFHLNWAKAYSDIESTDKEKYNCGFNQTYNVNTSAVVIINSPNYPEEYNNNDHCVWIFQADVGRHLLFYLLNFNIEETPSCFADTLSVYSSENAVQWNPVKENMCLSELEHQSINASTFIKVIFKTDQSVTREGFRASIKSVCGGLVTGTSGIIAPLWSDFNSRLRNTCDWLIKVRSGRTIELNFEHFNITSLNNECVTYVSIRNGDSTDSPIMSNGKHCGFSHESREKMESASNSVFVTFNYDGLREQFQSFRLRFEEKGPECGATGNLDIDHKWEVINSPNYPRVPLPYSECEWVFFGPPGEILRIDFIDRFDIKRNEACDLEFVEIHDGSSNLSPLKGTFCGSNPGTIKTTNNAVYIKYVTQLKDPSDGFKANVTIDVCGGTIMKSSGEITSPNYPHYQQLSPGSVCEWRIVGPPGHIFKITNVDIHLPESQNVCENKIIIEENFPVGNAKDPSILRTFCSEEFYEEVTTETSTNDVLIKLYIGNPSTWSSPDDYKGFKFTFNSSRPKCGGLLNSPQGTIMTPAYPQTSTMRFCQWRIVIPDITRRIQLKILDADLNENNHRIAIFNDKNFMSLIQLLPDSSLSISETQIFESTSNEMGLYILSSLSTSGHRFKAEYNSDEESLCGGDLSGQSGQLWLPALNRSFACKWQLDAKRNLENNLVDTFKDFNTLYVTLNLNTSSSRNYCGRLDPTLNIRAAVSDNRHYFIRNLCETQEISFALPTSEISLSAIQTRDKHMNFNVKWKLQPCGGLINARDDPVNILNIPPNYNDSINCAWAVFVPSGNRAELKLEGSFKLDCDKEFIKVRHGLSSRASVIGDYCKETMPEKSMVVQFSVLYIEYHSEMNYNNSDLRLITQTVAHQCGGTLSKYDSTFASPNYPNGYKENEECSWEIYTDLGYRVSLKFVNRFVIEESQNCSKDAVIIYDWKLNMYNEVAKLCGRNLPPTAFNSTYNRMKVVLRTDSDINLDGFKAQFNSICGGEFLATEKEQYLYSPGYLNSYEPLLDCTYDITAPDNKIVVTFEDFQLEGSYPDCNYDNVSISGIEFSTYCGKEIPPVSIAFGKISIIFKTDGFLQMKGFKLKYAIYNCGGVVREPRVLSSGPSDSYSNNMNCTWSIEAPTNKVIILKFLYIDIEGGDNCYSDYLEVFDSGSIDIAKRLALLCGNINDTGTVFRSTNNSMVLHFISDVYLTYSGFRADVTFSYGESVGCGGRINLTSSDYILKSPLLSGNLMYENFMDCHWTILAPAGKVINMEFKSFHIAPCSNVNQTALGISKCDCDFLQMKDGFNPHSTTIATYCGHTLPTPLVSSSNRLGIRLFTDGDIQSSGFEVQLTLQESICGINNFVLDTTNTIQLKSPGFDLGVIPRGIYCSYYFSIENEYGISVHIKIKSLDLQPGTSEKKCDKDKLAIVTHPVNNNISIGQNYILQKGRDDFFYHHYNSYYSTFSLPDRIELCSSKATTDFYMYDDFSVDIMTFPEAGGQNYKGFEFEVSLSTSCKRNYTESQGKIVSEYAWGSVSKNQNCYTLITAPENYTISIYFMSVTPDYLESDVYLDIFDGNSINSPKLVRIVQDYSELKPVFSTGRYLLLYNHEAHDNYVSYDLNYVTTNKGRGCGGRLHNEVGSVTSPLYPEVYRQSASCEWELETPVGTKLLLHFNVFDLGKLCNQNYLKLVDRNGADISTYCSEMPADYLSNDNYVKIVFITTRNNGGIGWVADFIGVL